MYVFGSSFHRSFPLISPEAWQINNYLAMDLIKRVFDYTGKYVPVITNTLTLKSKTMIDEDEYDMIDNVICNYDNSFQSGSFGGTSQVDVILSQTMIDLENVVDDTLLTSGIFYK